MNGCVSLLLCPVCDARLAADGRSLRCPSGHTFDPARRGHVDLLPAGHGRTGKEGDVPEMVDARRRFLAAGHFDPLLARVDALSVAQVKRTSGGAAAGGDGSVGSRVAVVLEVGAGDGSYVGRVARSAASVADVCCFGLDISTAALRWAARAHPGVLFFRNDVSHRICLADASVDVLLEVFAPRNGAEFARVSRPGASLLVVVPGAHHLMELREALPLLEIDPDKPQRVAEQMKPWFHARGVEAVDHELALTAEGVADLVRMTPNYWHIDDATLDRARSLAGRPVTASFRLLRFERRG